MGGRSLMSEVPCSQESSAGTRFTSRTSIRNTRFYSELEGRHSSFHVAPTHYSHTDACRMRRLLNLGRCSNVVHHRSVKSSPWLTQMVRPDGMRQATQRATKGENPVFQKLAVQFPIGIPDEISWESEMTSTGRNPRKPPNMSGLPLPYPW